MEDKATSDVVEDKATSDIFVVFLIKKLITPFETRWFSVISLFAKVPIFNCTILSLGWDLGISRLCSFLMAYVIQILKYKCEGTF